MDTQDFARDVETLFYALNGDSRLRDTPIQAGEIAPTEGEHKAFMFRLGMQQFVVALSRSNQVYYTNNITQ